MGALRAGFHGTVGQPSAQVIDGSLKFHGDKLYYFKKTPYVGNRKTWTISFWVKRSEGSSTEPGIFSTFAGVSGPAFTCYFNSSDKLRIYNDESGYNLNLVTAQVFRDYNSWYHIVISIDTTQTTASDRAKLYVNGVRVTEFSTELYPGDIDLDWNTQSEHNIGRHVNAYDGNISNFYHIDGHSFGPEYFGFTDPLTNTWRPKKLEQFPKRSFTNPRWYSSATVYTSVADVVANATDRGNGGVTVTNEYCYLVFNDGGYATSGGESASPDYPIWTDVPSFSGSTRVFYYDSNEADNWANAASYNSSAGEWNQWRYSNASSYEAYRISPYMDIENGNMLVFCANATADNPTNAGTLASITLPTFDTNSFHFQNAAVDTWYTGGNSFYLPFDGNSPIGKDKFNNGNDWTPWYFGGSNSIEKATGALPILNTTNGGNTATVGVRTDATVAAGVGTCALALPLVGNIDDVSNQIDSKSSQKTIILNGDPTGTTTVSNFYGGSYYFDGTGDYLNTTSVYSDLNFKTGDFTIEAWCYTSSSARAGLWQLSYTSGGLRPDNLQLSCHYQNDKFNFGSAGGSRTNGKEYSTNRWHHVAEVRKDGVISTYINGVLDQSWDDTSNYWEGDTYVCVGGYWNTSYLWNGYIQDFRIYNGVAKYTSDFIPASTNPDILPDTPSGVSGSSKLAKITEGAVAFDGDADSLTLTTSSDLSLDGDFTIEFYIYNNTIVVDTQHPSPITMPTDGTAISQIYTNSTNDYYGLYKSGDIVTTGNNSALTNKWQHVAFTRSGSTCYAFLDGDLKNTATSSETFGGTTGTYRIGSYNGSGGDVNAFISNLRVIKGTALYTSNFTPPTEPLTNVTNTKLLCCQSNISALISAVKPQEGSYTLTGVNYSSGNQVTGSAGLTGVDNIFNGKVGQYVDTNNYATVTHSNDNYILWTPTNAISYNSKVEIYCYAANGYGITNSYSLNGAAEVTFTGGESNFNDATWITVATGSGTLTSLKLRLQRSPNNSGAAWYAVRIDGTVLVNDFNGDPILGNGSVAATNFNPFNTDINTVRGQETNHCTWNPLHTIGTFTTTYQYSNGNLDFTTTGSPNLGGVATIGVKSGRWYWEIIHTELANNTYDTATYVAYDTFNRFTARDRGIAYLANGQKKMNDVNTDYGETYTTNDVIGVALDADNDKVTYFKNGRNQGELSITHLTTNTGYYPAIHQVNGSNNLTGSANFGQKPFKFPPPDGYQPLNNANVRPETVIARPDQYVGVTTYTGTDDPNHPIFVGFKPDLVWIKSRDATRNHRLTDTVRGAGKELYSDLPNSEGTVTDGVTLFTDNGFVLGANNNYNYTEDYVAWCWKAGDENVQYAADTFTDEVINKSESWHTTCDLTNPLNLFDNDIWNGATYFASTTRNITTNSFTATTIRIRSNGGNEGQIFSVNGTGYTFNTGNNVGTWNEIDLGTPTTVTSLQVSGTGNFTLYAIEVDGKVLVDSTSSLVFPGLASTVRANSKAGFSIIQYNGGSGERSVSHGLSSAPKFVVAKKTNAPNADWAIYHNSLGSQSVQNSGRYYLQFDTDPENFDDTYWDGKDPTDRVINLGTNTSTNTSGGEYIMYAWHDVPGLQKFGSYRGNADSNGAFVELGFRPALLWIKRSTDGANGWYVVDTERSPNNLANDYLYLNSATGDSGFTNGAVDILSNGFKMRANTQATNNATTYIYCAWAETPAINLYGGTSNAR